MSYLEAKLTPADDGRPLRQRRIIRAELVDSVGAKSDIVIRNVSATGLGAMTKGLPPLRGASVTIQMTMGLTMKGTVRWAEGAAFGIELETPVDLQKLGALIQLKHETVSRQGQWEVRKLHQINSGHQDQTKLRAI